MQVERVRTTDGQRRDGHLDRGVPRKTIHAAGREQILCLLSTAQDLQENGDVWRLERNAVDVERGLAAVVLRLRLADRDNKKSCG